MWLGGCLCLVGSKPQMRSRVTFTWSVGKRLARQGVNNYVCICTLLFIYYVFNCLLWHYVPRSVSQPFTSAPLPLSPFFYP